MELLPLCLEEMMALLLPSLGATMLLLRFLLCLCPRYQHQHQRLSHQHQHQHHQHHRRVHQHQQGLRRSSLSDADGAGAWNKMPSRT
jgi:ABC-type nickel/cobalt efflux system permease component RcnA